MSKKITLPKIQNFDNEIDEEEELDEELDEEIEEEEEFNPEETELFKIIEEIERSLS